MDVRVFGDPIWFQLGPVPVTVTMLSSLAVTVVVLCLAWLLRWSVEYRPDSSLATLARMSIRSIDSTVTDIVGRPVPNVACLTGSLFVFIAACNISGQLPGVHPATASLATTSALACIVFLAVPTVGIYSLGLVRYLSHYFSPNPLLLPLHLISELSRTLALAMRLFGNIMSGHLVVGLLIALGGLLVPMPFMALDLLIGLLQAYIFAILSTVFIGGAMGAGEET